MIKVVNAHIRELTTDELDGIAGGFDPNNWSTPFGPFEIAVTNGCLSVSAYTK